MTEPREPESPQSQGVPAVPESAAPEAVTPEAVAPEQAPVVPPAPPVIPAAPSIPSAPPVVAAAAPQAPSSEPVAPEAPVAPQADEVADEPEAAQSEPAAAVVSDPADIVVAPDVAAAAPAAPDAVFVPPVVSEPEIASQPEAASDPEAVPVPETVGAPETPAEPEAVAAPEPVAMPESPVEPPVAAPPTPGLPTVPAWVPPQAASEPSPVEDNSGPESAEVPAAAESAPESPEDPEPAVLLPPAPVPEPFQPSEDVVPAPTWGEPEAASDAGSVPPWGDLRSDPVSQPSVDQDAVSEEQRKLAAERAARRDARSAALASPDLLASSVDSASASPEPVAVPVAAKRTTDGFWASLGLFLLRLSLAAVFGIRGFQMLMDPAGTQKLLSPTLLPMPGLLGPVTAVASLVIAVALVVGLATRYAAIGGAVVAVGSLVWVYWGAFAVFIPVQGFLGESSVVTAAACLLLAFVGAGGWSLDRSLRAARQRDKAAKAAKNSARAIDLD